MRRVFLSSVVSVAAFAALACDHEADTVDQVQSFETPLIFGADNRAEYLSITDPKLKLKADATAAVIGDGGISCNTTTCTLTTIAAYNSGEVQSNPSVVLPLCSTVRFRGQLAEPHCTAFLVGPDTFVTAGHCMASNGVNTPLTCTNPGGGRTRAAFGFNANASGASPTSLPADQVYSCMAIDGKYTNTEDWAVFKVDRVVAGRTAMIVQYSSVLGTATGRGMVVFGHGFGLPLKMSPSALVKTDSVTNPITFESDADIFSGNSGGPGIDLATGVALGISVTAPNLPQHKSVSDGQGGQCAVPRTCSVSSGCPGWNGHTRLTYVVAAATSVRVPFHAALLNSVQVL